MRSASVCRPYCLAAITLACLPLFGGCGGGGSDSLTPEDPFPDAAGSYQLDGGFDGLSREQASFAGVLTLTQVSRQSGALSGTISLTLTIDGETSGGDSPVQSASVSPEGIVSFRLGNVAEATWTFTGTLAGKTINGRHTLSDGTQSFSGDWSGTSGAVSTGNLIVTASTSGSTPDPDGYTITLDGVDRGSLGGNASVTFSGLAAGSHTVGLSGVAANCQVQGDNLRAVTVSSGATATVAFTVTCTTSSAGSGTLRIITTTSGSQLDPDGYTVTLDGSDPLSLSTNGDVTLDGVASGDHVIGLSGVAANCAIQGNNPRIVSVSVNAMTTSAFIITCTTPPASTGTIRITTVTTGSGQDPNGYLLSYDGGLGQPIGVNATATILNAAAAPHTLGLSDIAGNCALQGSNPQIVTASAGATTDVVFTVNCTQTLASTTTTITDDTPDPSNPLEPVTVSFTVTSAAGIPSGIVVVTASGGKATCAVTLTQGQGSCQLTDLSVSGLRTLTATYQGDTLFASSSGQAFHTVN